MPNLGSAGKCDDPATSDKEIVVKKEANDPLEELDTILHEALHATYWDIKERDIASGARAIARFLWRLGYRR